MSENQLIPADLQGGELAREEDFDDMTSSVAYLPRLQLFGAKTDACAEGKIPIGHYGLVKDDEIIDLGEEVDLVVLTWRAKTMSIGGGAPISVFDAKSELFQKFKEQSFVKDSGCMYGNEYLVWIPEAGTFAHYHMNNKTSRREGKKMKPLIGCAVTLKCRLIDNQKYKWHGPVVLPCSTPLEMPAEDLLRAEYTKFSNPPPSEVELAEEDGRER